MSKRAQAIFYLALTALGLLILASGLPNLRFQAGLPIPGASTSGYSSFQAAGGSYQGMSLQMLLQTGLGLAFICLLGVLILSLLRKADLKKMAKLAGTMAAVILLMYIVGFAKFPELEQTAAAPEPVAAAAPPMRIEVAPIGDPPAGLVNAVLVAVIAGTAGLGGWLIYKATRKSPPDPLALTAAAALHALEEGQDLRNVILNCYYQMTLAVKSERGIEREEFMTPREFEDILSRRGVPAEPIHQLTALFEKVRYSRKPAGPAEEAQAVTCLTAIQRAFAAARRAP